jgi:hypothetical protein
MGMAYRYQSDIILDINPISDTVSIARISDIGYRILDIGIWHTSSQERNGKISWIINQSGFTGTRHAAQVGSSARRAGVRVG